MLAHIVHTALMEGEAQQSCTHLVINLDTTEEATDTSSHSMEVVSTFLRTRAPTGAVTVVNVVAAEVDTVMTMAMVIALLMAMAEATTPLSFNTVTISPTTHHTDMGIMMAIMDTTILVLASA